MDERPRHDQHEQQSEKEAEQRREHDGGPGDAEPAPDDRGQTGFHHPRAGQSADQSVGAARGDSQPPSQEVPDDGSHQRTEDHRRVDNLGGDNAGSDRLRDVQSEEKESDEIEECRPDHRIVRPQHARGNHSRDRVRSIMQPVQEVEGQRNQDEADEGRQGERADHASPNAGR
jgi:hypothetical protein